MSVSPPPPAIVFAIATWIPGIWPLFLGAANASLSRGDVVFSWWRSPQHNADVGGHPASQHLVGLAFDVASPSPIQLAVALRGVGFTVIESTQSVHAQTFLAGVIEKSGILDVLGLRRL